MFMDDPIAGIKTSIKGWLSGSLVVGAILGNFGIGIQIFMLIIGILLFIDLIFPFGITMFGVSATIFFVLGGIISFYFLIIDALIYYVVFCLAVVIISYAYSTHAKRTKVYKQDESLTKDED